MDLNPLTFPVTPPAVDAASWVLMGATTGQVLIQGNADERRNPASLTKLMTGYIVDRAIDSKRITRHDVASDHRKDTTLFAVRPHILSAWQADKKAHYPVLILSPGARYNL